MQLFKVNAVLILPEVNGNVADLPYAEAAPYEVLERMADKIQNCALRVKRQHLGAVYFRPTGVFTLSLKKSLERFAECSALAEKGGMRFNNQTCFGIGIGSFVYTGSFKLKAETLYCFFKAFFLLL